MENLQNEVDGQHRFKSSDGQLLDKFVGINEISN